MQIKPLGDRVVVKRFEASDKTSGGILLPDNAKDKPQKGKVLAVGEGRITKDGKKRELQVKVGDAVLFTSYAGDEFKIDGEKKVLVSPDTPIVIYVPGDKSELKPGTPIFISAATKQTDGTLTTPRVNVGRGVAPPM